MHATGGKQIKRTKKWRLGYAASTTAYHEIEIEREQRHVMQRTRAESHAAQAAADQGGVAVHVNTPQTPPPPPPPTQTGGLFIGVRAPDVLGLTANRPTAGILGLFRAFGALAVSKRLDA